MSKKESEIIKFEDGIINFPSYFPDRAVEVREENTFRILGFIKADQRSLKNGDLRIPLRSSSHFGIKCSEDEDKFPLACWAKFKTFKVKKLYFNHGESFYKVIVANIHDWREIVEDREKDRNFI